MPASPQCETATSIEQLSNQPLPELKKRWATLYKSTAPVDARKEYLARGIAYKIQEQQFGSLSASASRALRKPGTKSSASLQRPRLKPGSRLIREWQGTAHEVVVTETGYLYRDNAFDSLSVIARLITGTQWSGPLFFGLKTKRPSGTNANYVVDLTTKSLETNNGL